MTIRGIDADALQQHRDDSNGDELRAMSGLPCWIVNKAEAHTEIAPCGFCCIPREIR